MTHLSESEYVDLAEDALAPDRAAHAETCASCREQAAALRAMLHETASIDVPEPSPLFWQHLSARVRDGVAAESVPNRSGWRWMGTGGLVPLGAAAAVVAVISGALLLRAVQDGRAPSPIIVEHAAVTAEPEAGRPSATPDADNAEVWDVLTSAASTVGFDEAHAAGMQVRPAAIDHAVQDLSAAELTELGRLLQSELKRSSN